MSLGDAASRLGLSILVLIGVAAVSPKVGAGETAMVRDDAEQFIDLAPYAEVLIDPAATLDFAAVRRQEQASRFEWHSASPGYTDAAVWMRFTVRNAADRVLLRWFDTGNRSLQEIDFYAPDAQGNYVRQSASAGAPFLARPLPFGNFVFAVELVPRQSTVMYLRLRSTSYASVFTTPRLWQPETFRDAANRQDLVWAGLTGIACALCLVNLLLWVYLRDRPYLLYSLSIASYGYAISSYLGGYGSAWRVLWPEWPLFELCSSQFVVMAVNLWPPVFITSLLSLDTVAPKRMCWIRRFIAAVMLGCVIVLFLNLLLPHSHAAEKQTVWITVDTVSGAIWPLLLTAIVSALRAGSLMARYVLIAFAPLLLSIMHGSLYPLLVGQVPTLTMSNIVAAAFEWLVMAVALAHRFFLERNAKLAAQAQAIAALRVSERELEAKVALRTHELSAANRALDAWNHTLEQRVADGVAERERLERLRRFFSPAVADAVIERGDAAMLPHRREIVVVFLDLRGYTAFTDTHSPAEVMTMLGEFHQAMGELVMAHNGTLERFTGDGMMIFFNDPVKIADPAGVAVRMALAMQRRFGELKTQWQQRGYDLRLGIGIAQGEATLGAIGFEGRRDYGAIGGVTNLAARLCAEAEGGQVLLCACAARHVGTTADLRACELALKGFARPQPAFAWTPQE